MAEIHKKKEKDFDWNKELGHIGKWIFIAIAISGASWGIFGVPKEFIPFVTIISILIIVIILQYKKIKTLEQKK